MTQCPVAEPKGNWANVGRVDGNRSQEKETGWEEKKKKNGIKNTDSGEIKTALQIHARTYLSLF